MFISNNVRNRKCVLKRPHIMKKEWEKEEQEGGRNTVFPLLKRVQFHAQYHWNTYCFSSDIHSWNCKNRKYGRSLKIIWKLFFILFFIFGKKKVCKKYIKYTFDIRNNSAVIFMLQYHYYRQLEAHLSFKDLK